MSISAVIFDMDGVLIDSAEAHKQSWRVLAGELHRTVSDEEFIGQFGRPSRDIIRNLFGAHLPDEVVARYDCHKEEAFRDLVRGRLPVMPGAARLVQALDEAGFALAVGSSGPPENVSLCLEDPAFEGRFDAVVTGMDVEFGKPDPQVFLLAAEHLGAEPSACVVVEDAPAGIEAANRAGMKSIALTSTHRAETLGRTDWIVSALSEITPDLIRRL